MNRPKWYAFIIVLLLLSANVAWWIYSQWGLITVHADKTPLRLVMKSIEKQGHILLRSDMPAETEVTMQVDKVCLTEALEALSASTEGRWRLTYLVGPNKTALAAAMAQWTSGQRPADWKPVSASRTSTAASAQDNSDDDDPPPADPRRELWDGQPLAPPQPNPGASQTADGIGTAPLPDSATASPAPAPSGMDGTLRAWLKAVAQKSNVSFSLPADWNPRVSRPPSAGEVRSVVPKLAALAGGQSLELFLLSGPRRSGPRDNGGQQADDRGDQGGGGDWGGQASPEQRAAFEAIRDLPPEERRAKMAEMRDQMMSDPVVQNRILKRSAKRDSYRTPAQRLKGYKRYIARKEAAAK